MAEQQLPQAPFYEDLVTDFTSLYEPCTMTTIGVIDFTIPMLRDFFGAYQDFTTGLDPLPQYLDALRNEGYHQRHNHEHERVIFVKDRYADYVEVVDD